MHERHFIRCNLLKFFTVALQAVTRTIFNGVLNQSSAIVLIIDVKRVTAHLVYLKYSNAHQVKAVFVSILVPGAH